MRKLIKKRKPLFNKIDEFLKYMLPYLCMEVLEMKTKLAAKGRVRVTAQVENVERPHTGAQNALQKNGEGNHLKPFLCLYNLTNLVLYLSGDELIYW